MTFQAITWILEQCYVLAYAFCINDVVMLSVKNVKTEPISRIFHILGHSSNTISYRRQTVIRWYGRTYAPIGASSHTIAKNATTCYTTREIPRLHGKMITMIDKFAFYRIWNRFKYSTGSHGTNYIQCWMSWNRIWRITNNGQYDVCWVPRRGRKGFMPSKISLVHVSKLKKKKTIQILRISIKSKYLALKHLLKLQKGVWIRKHFPIYLVGG